MVSFEAAGLRAVRVCRTGCLRALDAAVAADVEAVRGGSCDGGGAAVPAGAEDDDGGGGGGLMVIIAD